MSHHALLLKVDQRVRFLKLSVGLLLVSEVHFYHSFSGHTHVGNMWKKKNMMHVKLYDSPNRTYLKFSVINNLQGTMSKMKILCLNIIKIKKKIFINWNCFNKSLEIYARMSWYNFLDCGCTLWYILIA